MKGKIISVIIIFLMIFGSIGATGINNQIKKDYIDLSEKSVQNPIIIEDSYSKCSSCGNYEYSFGMLDNPINLLNYDNFVDVSGEPPDSWDWRDATYAGVTGNWITPVKDQGKCGSCGSFAALACFESAYKMYKEDPNIDVDFSEQYMVSCGKEWIGNKYYIKKMLGCKGANLFGVFEFIKQYGAINETCFPYISGIDGYEPPCSDKCENWEGQKISVKNYKLVQPEFIRKGIFTADTDPKNIKNALFKYGPLATVFFVFEDFLNYTGGIYELNRSKPWRLLGAHGTLIVGYKDDPSIDTGGYWICKNSWGPDWGENGYFRAKYDDFYRWLYNEWLCRLLNIRSLRDLLDFIDIHYKVVFYGIPLVGIEFGCGYFTGINKEIIEAPEQNEIFSYDNTANLGIYYQQDIFFPMIKFLDDIQFMIKRILLKSANINS